MSQLIINRLDRVEITGFWGGKTVGINFFSDVNFIIGINGSGKTTIINMIAAALLADFYTLNRLSFESIKIELSEVGGRKKPTIVINKIQKPDSPYYNITYRIREKASDKFNDYSLDDFEEDMMVRRRMPARYFHRHMENMNRGILSKLEGMVNVSWLSIHRAKQTPFSNEEESFESLVDKKLDELNVSLSKYFSVLTTKANEEVEKFQRKIIASLITEYTERTIFSSIEKLDLNVEKKALSDVFSRLKISGFEKKLEEQYKGVKSAREQFKESKGLTIVQLMQLTGAFKSHSVVQNWNSLLEKQVEIQSPRENFLKVLNNLFEKKDIRINARNEITALTDSGKELSITDFSSGEKQLIIILGEALLQRSSPWLYIADEPELSLHVKWQEALIENLRCLNPQAQIVCATHSPDIVSSFTDKTFDAGEIIN